MASCSYSSLKWMYIINHVFLPPKLPQKNDINSDFEEHLAKQVLDTLITFKETQKDSSDGHLRAINAAIDAVSNLLLVHNFDVADGDATIKRDTLEAALISLTGNVTDTGALNAIPLKVAAQNAGILAYRHKDSARFEMFELSAQNSGVVDTLGRLKRKFPGVALSIRVEDLEPAFIKTLSGTLDRMSSQVAPGTLPLVQKGGRDREEVRDTARPKMVTELLAAFMLCVGQAADVRSIRKHTRDEVLWKDCLSPWSRSSMFLLIRVSIQLIFLRSGLEVDDALSLYKHFMLLFHVRVLTKTSQILQEDQRCTEWCDIVYIMWAKVFRRLLKLDTGVPQMIQDAVHSAMKDTVVSKTWTLIQKSRDQASRINIEPLRSLDFGKDTLVALPKLEYFLASIERRNKETMEAQFTPSCPLPNAKGVTDWGNQAVPSSAHTGFHAAWWGITASNIAKLSVRELQGLSFYTQPLTKQLWNVMRSYEGMVRSEYKCNPETWSLMVLGVFELWVACDRLTRQEYPILDEYDPDIDIRRLQCLLLPFRTQMERLRAVEEYIVERRRQGTKKDIWTSFGLPDTFAVRYFNQSPKHQDLRRRIEETAIQEREQKMQEYNNAKARYAQLMHEYETTKCETAYRISKRRNQIAYHPSSCARCYAYNTAKDMKLNIHEWPLPTDQLALKTIVFELQVPELLSIYRQATMFIRFNVLKCSYIEKAVPENSKFPLSDDIHVKTHFHSSPVPIGLLSRVKPQAKTHYAGIWVSSLSCVEELFFDNASRFEYFDFSTERDCFVTKLEPVNGTKILAKSTTYLLPSKSSTVQQFIRRLPGSCDGPPPNTVLSAQADCPSHLSLTEFKALSSIPLGHRIQWQNILVQVTAPSVDFEKVETCMVVLQCMYQAGPRENTPSWHRDGHVIPESTEVFCRKMLTGLRQATVRIEENWRCIHELSTYVAIARRILSLTASGEVKLDVLAYLSEVRKVGLQWVTVLKDRVDGAVDEEKSRFRSRVAHAALVCVDTFNVQDTLDGDDILGRVLLIRENTIDYLQCCIVIQETYVPDPPTLMESILYWRWQELSVRVYPILQQLILNTSSDALDLAIKNSWVSYSPTEAGWVSVSIPDCRHIGTPWLTTESASRSGGANLAVHYCLITGELRVNGLPLNRLPLEYETNAMYTRLFGRAVLEVMPSDVPGMVFSCKKHYAQHELHFGLSDGLNLLIRAAKDGRVWEFVNPPILQGFPVEFMSDYVHWYEAASDTVEFRPLADPWSTSDDNWMLCKKQGKYQLQKAGEDRILIAPRILNMRSQTAIHLDAIFSPIVSPSSLHLIYRPSLSQLEIELPGLKLAFHLRLGSDIIQSRQFRGMSVDPNQEIGTLIGFDNKLVLKSDSEDAYRKVIVIEGVEDEDTLASTKSHIQVSIDVATANRAHVYDVNTRLGRLVDNGSLESKLRICYLHAVTSFCLPDPLTKRTGTEQALDILHSAAVKSFAVLSQEHNLTLLMIANLTPSRAYYPTHLKVMQTVSWNRHMGFLAQHNGFHQVVTSLLEAAAGRQFFYRDHYSFVIQLPKEKQSRLVRRDEIRGSTFRVPQYGAEEHTARYDCEYVSRDMGQDSGKAHEAFAMADYVINQREQLPHEMPESLELHIWEYLRAQAGGNVVGAASRPFSTDRGETPEYDAQWLIDTCHETLGKKLLVYHDALSRKRVERFKVAIWLSTLAFAKGADLPVIQVLGSFFNVHQMALIQAPTAEKFIPRKGDHFLRATVKTSLNSEVPFRPFASCPESRGIHGMNWNERADANSLYEANCQSALESFVDCAEKSWPCARPQLASHSNRGSWETYIDPTAAAAVVHRHTAEWFDNYELNGFLGRIVEALPASGCSYPCDLRKVKHSVSAYVFPSTTSRPGFISESDTFLCPPPDPGCLVPRGVELPCPKPKVLSTPAKAGRQSASLNALIQQLRGMATVAFEESYIESLQQSVNLLSSMQHPSSTVERVAHETLEVYLAQCKSRSEELYSIITNALSHHMSSFMNLERHKSGDTNMKKLFSAHLPRISASFLLQSISRTKWESLPSGWRAWIIEYAVSLTDVQRAERMVSASRRNDLAALSSEFKNTGRTNWDPLKYPESLLLEVESGITIREVQEDIAAQMRSPPGGMNAVMQLNMGEGKSSVIVPIVAAALADGTRLVRVLVAKPQSKQMLQMLISKLGGLLDRVVFQMPFSRALRVSGSEAQWIHDMLERCRDKGGVLLVQPEHILSYQQMGTEYAMLEDKSAIASTLNLTRHFLFNNARDIVDESDENFSVKFELVYTIGNPQSVDHSPHRWKIIQEILGIIRGIVPGVRQQFPDAVQIQDTSSPPGSFPRTRVLTEEAMEAILSQLATRICDSGISGFPISRQVPAVREAVRTYITKRELSNEEIRQVEHDGPSGFWTETVRPTLALLRGLIAYGVLGFSFMQKRWRVNYGLAPNRMPATKLTVPYQAKDQPSARSEFSHPDVVIILTCLTYYYSGLSDEDLFLALNTLYKSQQADVEYGLWVRENVDMGEKFKTLAGVNTEDRSQCTRDIFPHLRFSKGAIDYFLSNIVYPKQMKEFPSKLSASGWDLGEEKVHPTTGFSGTNDSRRLLPLGMAQRDLEGQRHTNALVMSYLLQPETSVTDIPSISPTQVSDADALLDLVVGLVPPVRVILDVGAQVLELNNLEVAQQWLQRITDDHTKAVVFFDDNDELSVVDRSGYIERLQTSPFASQMDACLVFLDEAHTRGTDLKLPSEYRAAVTLGANQTKDGLMQGCMRMRKLGHGQSVVFCVPREIQTKVKALLHGDDRHRDIQVSDILLWSIKETWSTLQRGVQLWAVQGRRHQKHQRLWNLFTEGEKSLDATQAEQFLEDEAQTILQRYRTADAPQDASQQQAQFAHVTGDDGVADLISERLGAFGATGCDRAALHEEQERELDPEVETERHHQLPPPTVPARHRLHRDVYNLVTDGRIIPTSTAYMPAFRSLGRTFAGQAFGISNIPQACAPNLLVSADFAETVELPKTGKVSQDAYLRSVQWILVHRRAAGKSTMLIISPYEANTLIPAIAEAQETTLHVYCPRVNPAFPSLDDLNLFAFPRDRDAHISPQLTVGLNLFSGQLYFNDHATYVAACRFLGLSWEKARDGETLDPDGFILRDALGRVGGESGFAKSPVKFIRDLILIRRDLMLLEHDLQVVGRSHVGDMLDNRPLSEDSFD